MNVKKNRWKPGQSGNSGGRPRTAKLSDACRAKLASLVPGDATGRTHAEAIADELARRALTGDIRAAQELADRAEGRPGQNNPVTEANQGGQGHSLGRPATPARRDPAGRGA